MNSRLSSGDGLAAVLVGDGRPLLGLGAAGLAIAGGFAYFLSAGGVFLPHDLAFLGMEARELARLAGGGVADFMFHDRVAFGGTLVAIAVLYAWLVAVPLSAGAAWAWWLLALSAGLGFASFLAWLGYGYLDAWHATATAVLLPLFVGGLWRTRPRDGGGPRSMLVPGHRPERWSRAWLGRSLVLLTGLGMVVAGTTILTIGAFVVFVPQDIGFLGLNRAALDAINPRLVPLIAHDRSGFGGGLATVGMVTVGCAWCAPPSRSLWQALLVAGVAGFGSAIGIHGLIGYLDASHVGPAVVGAAIFAVGMVLARPLPDHDVRQAPSPGRRL